MFQALAGTQSRSSQLFVLVSGFVQIDDAYLGGEFNGGEPGRGSPNKQAFLIAA